MPSRNFVYQQGERFNTGIRRTDELFRRFKTGEANLAFPLALGIREALATRELDSFEAVVPIPLSPDKAADLAREFTYYRKAAARSLLK